MNKLDELIFADLLSKYFLETNEFEEVSVQDLRVFTKGLLQNDCFLALYSRTDGKSLVLRCLSSIEAELRQYNQFVTSFINKSLKSGLSEDKKNSLLRPMGYWSNSDYYGSSFIEDQNRRKERLSLTDSKMLNLISEFDLGDTLPFVNFSTEKVNLRFPENWSILNKKLYRKPSSELIIQPINLTLILLMAISPIGVEISSGLSSFAKASTLGSNFKKLAPWIFRANICAAPCLATQAVKKILGPIALESDSKEHEYLSTVPLIFALCKNYLSGHFKVYKRKNEMIKSIFDLIFVFQKGFYPFNDYLDNLLYLQSPYVFDSCGQTLSGHSVIYKNQSRQKFANCTESCCSQFKHQFPITVNFEDLLSAKSYDEYDQFCKSTGAKSGISEICFTNFKKAIK